MLLSITPRIREFLHTYPLPSDDSSDRDSHVIKVCLEKGHIDHRLLRRIRESTGDDGKQDMSIRHLLNGSKFIFRPNPPSIDPSTRSSYKKVMQDARNILAEREYNEMTRNVDHVSPDRLWDPKEFRVLTRQLIALTNAIFSIGAVAAATYFVSGSVSNDIGMRVLLSFATGFIVLFAEGWFFTRYALALDDDHSK